MKIKNILIFFFNIIKAGFTKINKGVKIRSSSNILYEEMYLKKNIHVYYYVAALLY